MKVNSEFYMGWFDVWGENHATGPTTQIIKTLKEILDYGASVNM